MNDDESRGIARRAVRATAWFTSGSLVTLTIALVRSVILARLLAPEDFGVVAFALFLASIFGLVRGAGLNYALIHKPDPDQATMATFLLSGLTLSFAALLLAVVASPILGGFYSSELISVMLVLTLVPILHAGASLPSVMMEKELQFARVTSINLTASVTKSVIPIWMALNGYGLWAIVAVEVIDAITRLIMGWMLRPVFPGLRGSRKSLLYYWEYGKQIWSATVANTIVFHFSSFVVGSLSGLRALGFFSKAQEFSQYPTLLTSSIVSRVTLPTYAKLQDDKASLSRAFELVLSAIVRISAWLGLLLVVGVYELTVLLLGERWLPLVIVVQALAVWVVLRPVYDDAAALLTAVGRPEIFARLSWVQAIVLLIAGPLLTIAWGLIGAAAAIDLMLLAGLFYFFRFRVREIVNIALRRALLPPIVVALFSAVLVFLVGDLILAEPSLSDGSVPWLVKLVLESILASGLFFAGLLVFDGRHLKEQVEFVRGIMSDQRDND